MCDLKPGDLVRLDDPLAGQTWRVRSEPYRVDAEANRVDDPNRSGVWSVEVEGPLEEAACGG